MVTGAGAGGTQQTVLCSRVTRGGRAGCPAPGRDVIPRDRLRTIFGKFAFLAGSLGTGVVRPGGLQGSSPLPGPPQGSALGRRSTATVVRAPSKLRRRATLFFFRM